MRVRSNIQRQSARRRDDAHRGVDIGWSEREVALASKTPFNATGTGIRHRHERTEEACDGGFTVRYLDGPKTGLEIHFFAAAELAGLIGKGFTPLMPLRLDSTPHVPPATGQWSQWEAIWRRRAAT